MMSRQFVRVGSLAEVHVASTADAVTRGRRVIVRTSRGVELGEVIGPCRADVQPIGDEIRILRSTSPEDELLIRRLERHKREAVEACRDELCKSGSESILLDVDQLLDGGTLVMHFLGPVDEVAERVTAEVVERYESVVRSRHFAKLLRDGCGPDCGTSEGGCSGGCAGCSVASACKTPLATTSD